MDKRRTIFDYLGSVFMLYGITVLLLILIKIILGDTADGTSNMFMSGHNTLSITVLLQFLGTSFMIVGLEYLFFSESIIKEATTILRTTSMLISMFIVMSICISLFEWFPAGEWLAWILFVGSFFLSYIVSVVLLKWKEALENKQMQEGLKRMKAKIEEEKGNV